MTKHNQASPSTQAQTIQRGAPQQGHPAKDGAIHSALGLLEQAIGGVGNAASPGLLSW